MDPIQSVSSAVTRPLAPATVRNDTPPPATSQPPATDTVEISGAAREALRQSQEVSSQSTQDAAQAQLAAQQATLQRISTQ